jgi:hypothetical protein
MNFFERREPMGSGYTIEIVGWTIGFNIQFSRSGIAMRLVTLGYTLSSSFDMQTENNHP